VVYFTATFPYLVLIALLVRGLTLDGAMEGIKLLFIPKWEKMLEINVWRDAASQMFFSLGVSWGGLVMFGSYNKFHNKINWDAAFVSSMDFFTSIISSCVVFSILGFLSKETGVPVAEVAKGGQGLAFIAYPEALSTVPLAPLWAILFFLMLFFLGLDSEFALLETVLTAIYDGFPKARAHKVKLTFAGCLACFLLGLPCVSFNGQYVLNLMDTYGAGFAVIWIALWEVVALMWIYGVCNFSKVIFILSLVYWQTPSYNQTVPYPEWAHWLGWVLVGISAVQVPLWAVLMSLVYLCKRKLTSVVKPTRQWGPGDPQVRRAIYEEQHNIAPARKHNNYSSSSYNTGYDNQAISAYNM
jgi:solute carrier family 6 amino acid transporter-like protein 5/7/9/14